jgi:hypothetical protein
MRAPRLRVVQVFWGTPLVERSFPIKGARVTCGEATSDSFSVGGLGTSLTLFHSGRGGLTLHTLPEMRGTLHLGGYEQTVGGASPVEHRLSPGDWGIFSLDAAGAVAFFFQLGETGQRLRAPLVFDRNLASGVLLAATAITALLLIAFLIGPAPVEEDLAAAPERLAKLILDKDWPEKPEKAEKERRAREERRVRAEDMSKRAAGREGKFGDARSNAKDSRLQKGPRDVIADRVRQTGLLGIASKARSGDTAFGRLLSTNHDGDVTMALAGVGTGPSVIGQGAGGLGTRGDGPGGGGHGPGGQIMGIGNIATGTGGNARSHHPGGGAGHVAKERSVDLNQGAAGTDGSLSREQIYRVVASHVAAIQFCFEKELQRFPKLTGKVVLGWRVELDGSVSGARVDSSTLSHPPTEGCMVRQLKTWSFPKPQGTVAQVSFPFLFRGQ